MTKPRPPLTFHGAVWNIAQKLGFDVCGDIIGRSPDAVRKYSDPLEARHIKLGDAVRLDIAYLKNGGVNAPIFDVYAAKINDDSDNINLGGFLPMISLASVETGEAIAASIMATKDPRQINNAILQIKEAVEILTSIHNNMERECQKRE